MLEVRADFHLHSKYSRATSRRMVIPEITKYAKMKGLNLLGTGDFTNPFWLERLKRELKPIEGKGLFKYDDVYFMLTTEVSTVFQFEGETKKIHHIIHVPSFEIAEQVNESLFRYGDLRVDGRPTLNMTAPELVEIIIGIYKNTMITSAHIWTPWYSCLGSRSGFDSIEECYQDQTKYIFSLETGLSSSPEMNWRVSSLDKFTLVSNSDSHSPYPSRIGREANFFEIAEDKLSYEEIYNIIRKKDKKRFKMTVELDPRAGKYHFTGHRKCDVKMSPEEAMKRDNICPVCGKKLTVGVMQRVVKLADRPKGFVPKNAIPYVHLIPLQEIIASVMGIDTLYSKEVWRIFNKLINRFGNEYNILLNVPGSELEKVVSRRLANAIIRVRKGKVEVEPGFDGRYGTINIFGEGKETEYESPQKSLSDFD